MLNGLMFCCARSAVVDNNKGTECVRLETIPQHGYLWCMQLSHTHVGPRQLAWAFLRNVTKNGSVPSPNKNSNSNGYRSKLLLPEILSADDICLQRLDTILRFIPNTIVLQSFHDTMFAKILKTTVTKQRGPDCLWKLPDLWGALQQCRANQMSTARQWL